MDKKYLKYAIGEIFLVVVGILIALSINNWNEQRKQKAVLNNILLEIHSNLLQDSLNLKLTIDAANDLISRLHYVEDYGNGLPIDTLADRISDLHWLSNWDPVTSGYEKLVGTGMEVSLPRQLQESLDYAYTLFNWSANQNKATDLTLYSLNKFREYLIKIGFPLTNVNGMVRNPKDKMVLKQAISDPEFIGIIRNHEYNLNAQLDGYHKSLARVLQLSKMLEAHFDQEKIKFNSID